MKAQIVSVNGNMMLSVKKVNVRRLQQGCIELLDLFVLLCNVFVNNLIKTYKRCKTSNLKFFLLNS